MIYIDGRVDFEGQYSISRKDFDGALKIEAERKKQSSKLNLLQEKNLHQFLKKI